VLKLVPVPEDGFPPVAVQEKVTGGVPPVDVAVHRTAIPTVPVVGQLIVTVRPVTTGLMKMVADAVAVLAFASVTATLTVCVPTPAYVVVKLEPVPEAGVPPVAVQANVWGVVPPVPVAVNVTGTPVVPVVGPLNVTARTSGAIVTAAELVAVTGGVALSVAVTLIVTEPFTLYCVVKVAPVPVEGVPPVAVQAKVIGPVPPVAIAVHTTGLLTVPVVGHVTVRDRAPGLMFTVIDTVAVFPFASVIVTPTVWGPDTANIVVKLEPVPDDGVPPVAVQAKV